MVSFGKVILSRDVSVQRSLSRDFCSCPCPGTEGRWDKEIFLFPDKGTTGRPVPDCPGTSLPLEALIRITCNEGNHIICSVVSFFEFKMNSVKNALISK